MKTLGYVPAWIESREWMGHRLQGVLPDSYRSDGIYSSFLAGRDVAGQLMGREVVNQSLYVYNTTCLPGYVLTILGDRMEMAHSVEGRLPFLDHHVVEFARRLPVSQKIRGAAEKFVLRKAMRRMLPPDICGRRKCAFKAPPALLNREQRLYQLMQDTLRGGALNRLPFLNRQRVIGILDGSSIREEPVAWEMPLMTIFSACVLADRFGL